MAHSDVTDQAGPISRAPNVVIVICDDIGYGDLECNGGTVIATPQLNKLASRGVRVTSMINGGPTCSPARAALLTGRVAPRTGVGRVLFPNEDRGLHLDEKTIASYLGREGYATGCFGKWHVGNLPERGPIRFGFDTYFGLPFSNDTPPYLLYRNEEVLEESPDISTLTGRYVDAAIEFIEQVDDDIPFFAYVAFAMPHYPVSAGTDFQGVSEGGPYGDVVEEIDHHCGRLFDQIEELGRFDNTIIIFLSDHGPWFEGSTGGVRGRKFETWEGGTRVPFIASWPDRIEGGRVVDQALATIDVLPTLCSVLGISEDPSHFFDGEDVLQTLTSGASDEHGPIWYFDGYSLNAVRRGKWKLHRRRQTWGAERFAQMSLPQLFNLEIDRDESYDLSSRFPQVVSELESAMRQFESTLDLSDDDKREWWKQGNVVLRDG